MFDPVKLLQFVLGLPKETEYLEFKENNLSEKTLGELISAISNAACLCDVEYGYVVYGIEDSTHTVVGTKLKPRSIKIGGEDMELWLQKMLDPSINFEIFELDFNGMPVVIFKIPAATERPLRFQSQSYIRIGSNMRNLKEFPEKEAIIWNKARNRFFEKLEAIPNLSEDEVLKLLDYPSYFRLTDQSLPGNPSGILDFLIKEGFVKQEDGTGYAVTNLGAILFANDLSQFPSLKRKAARVVVYEGMDRTKTVKDREGKRGYAVGFENLIEFINDQLPSNEEIEKALRVQRKMYPEIAIRELVANALIHQDLTERGTGPSFEIFSDRIEISNPGRPLIEVDRFLDHKPQSRNEQLAAFLRRIGVCEERGSGIDKVFKSIEVFQLPAPKFDVNDKYLNVILFAPQDVREMSKEDRIRACFQHACLRHVSNETMTNASLRERFKLSDSKTDSVFASNIISEAIKAGKIKLLGDDPNARKSAKYGPPWA
ncbi:putative DNA binding domain-containing protein [Candidatus Kaiserbacteria bacterium]|nr:putative DNA binding domain-containing protein [Candidatus Kaiserbacteria bacterium]